MTLQIIALRTASAALALTILPTLAHAQVNAQVGWPPGDELGMANNLGPATWARCAPHLANPNSRSYELSYLRSNTMPQSPFAVPMRENAKPTAGIPHSLHAFNTDEIASGDPGQQGTQMDALGHFGYLPIPWDGKREFLPHIVMYYGSFSQEQVKPTPSSPLLKLGIEKVPPIVTTAVLLDAKTHLGGGKPMEAGAIVKAADIEAMLKAQGLAERGILKGDVLYIYTGWGDHWKDPDTEKFYYTKGPGLAFDAAVYLEKKQIVLLGIDNPFTDPVPEGMLQGKAEPPPGTPVGHSFPIHHYNLTQAGIHNIQNANLAALARDKVWVSCTMILALRTQGASGSPVRPVSIGVPNQ